MTKALAYSLALTVASLLVLMLRAPLEASLLESYENKFISELLASSIPRLLLIIGLVYFIYKKGFLRFNGLAPSFTVSNLHLLLIGIVVILLVSYSSYEDYMQAQPHKLVLFGISNALIGLFEELLFRGIVFPLLIIHFADSKRPVFKAVCLSALIFGLIHLVGLIRHPENVWGVINTVIFATGMGFLFAVLMLRTRNILVPAFIHFLVDFTNNSGVLKEAMVAPSVQTQQTIILTLAVVLALAFILIGVSLFFFKPVKSEEWLQKVSFVRI